MSPDTAVRPDHIRMPAWISVVFALLALAGTASFLVGINSPDPLRTWQAYLVNFVFWTGLSFGQVCFLATLNVTGARWGRPLKRLSEALGAYLPVGFLLFWVLYPGRNYLFPWISHPVPEKQAWLNVPFLFLRDGAGMLLLCLLSTAMIYFSTRDGSGESATSGSGNTDGNWQRQKVLSPIIAITYAFVLTFLGFDLVMSLDPHWYSSLFGGYFFIGSFYTGIAALYLLAPLAARSDALRASLQPRHFHDLGKLTFAFCLFTGYLFYAQFLVMWYGNLPEETRYVILRVKLTPWEPLAWAIFAMIFVAPFVFLLGRKAKMLRPVAISVCLAILVGMWLEKFILIAPSLWTRGGIPLGVTEVLVTAGFLGVFGLCATTFLKRTTALPMADPLFAGAAEMARVTPVTGPGGNSPPREGADVRSGP